MKNISILGSTGSIGVSTLDVLSRHTDKYKVIALTAHKNVDLLLQQCKQFQPRYAVMVDKDAAQQLKKSLGKNEQGITVLAGHESLEEVASLAEVDVVMAAIVGAAGLLPCLAAAKSGKRILLANKEALVMAGQLFMDTVKEHNAELLPIDSEHNAIFQCLDHKNSSISATPAIKKVLLTASGGPFLGSTLEEMALMTPEQACAHPNWDMGRKISVDSATMMNKGLEVIEACWLFGLSVDDIEVVIHPQSVIHSMVEYVDGSILAQLGSPDMRTPIAYGLAWPERISSGVKTLNLFEISRLDFQAPDFARFPCLKLAMDTMRTASHATPVLNAANEVAVEAFLQGRIAFTYIAKVVAETLAQLPATSIDTLSDILAADHEARRCAQSLI